MNFKKIADTSFEWRKLKKIGKFLQNLWYQDKF